MSEQYIIMYKNPDNLTLDQALATIERYQETVADYVEMYRDYYRKNKELNKELSDLLYQVQNKYPGESRYETAMRYIKEHEYARCQGANKSSEEKPNVG